MSRYSTDPALLEAVGLRLGEQRAGLANVAGILRRALTALLESDAEERVRLVEAALADLDTSTRHPLPLTTVQVMQQAERSGYAKRG